jgi:hypothetical protein
VAEGNGLLNRHTNKIRIGGSNPPRSARVFTKKTPLSPERGVFLVKRCGIRDSTPRLRRSKTDHGGVGFGRRPIPKGTRHSNCMAQPLLNHPVQQATRNGKLITLNSTTPFAPLYSHLGKPSKSDPEIKEIQKCAPPSSSQPLQQ